MITMRLTILFIVLALNIQGARAAKNTPYTETKIIETGQPFTSYLTKLKSAIRANKMGIVAEACATCGAKAIGVTIPGNRVVMIFNPFFAVRMLKASEAAGIEAPLRLYVTEKDDKTARLTYRTPSATFGVYNVPALDVMAKELDQIIEKIVAQAAK
jgi:uncharacterized protein (DUF302 family)